MKFLRFRIKFYKKLLRQKKVKRIFVFGQKLFLSSLALWLFFVLGLGWYAIVNIFQDTGSAQATTFSYSENFSTTTYKDASNTTAHWVTGQNSVNAGLTTSWTNLYQAGGSGISGNQQNGSIVYGDYTIYTREQTALSPTFDNDEGDCGANADKCTIFFVHPRAGIFRSQDKGATWTDVTPTGVNPLAVAISPTYVTDSTVLFGDAFDGLYRSTDAGASWSLVNDPSGAIPISRIAFSPTYATDSTIFIGEGASGDGKTIYRSTDGGATWTDLSSGITETDEAVYDIDISPNYANDNTVFAVVGGNTNDTDTNDIWRSSDGGDTWTLTNTGINSTWAWSLALTPNFSNVAPKAGKVYVGFSDTGAVGGEVTYASSDQGDNWTAVRTTNKGSVVEISPNFAVDSTLYLGAAGDYLYKCTDGTPLNCTSLGTGAGVLYAAQILEIDISPAYATDNTFFANGLQDVGVVKNINAGAAANWSYVDGIYAAEATDIELPATYNGNESDCTGNPDNCSVFTLSNLSGVFKSTDKGLNFTKKFGDWSYGTWIFPISLGIAPNYAANQTVFTANLPICGAGVSGKVYKSTDGGDTWNAGVIPAGGCFSDSIKAFGVAPNYNDAGTGVLFFGTDNEDVYQSTDSGANYTSVLSGMGGTVSGVQVSPSYATDNTVAASTIGNGVFTSTTGGGNGTWSQLAATAGWSSDFVALSPDFDNSGSCKVMFTNNGDKLKRSTDGGTTWTEVKDVATASSSDYISRLVFLPPYDCTDASKQNLVFIHTTGGAYKSTDNGTTWTAFNTGINNNGATIDTAMAKGGLAVSPNYAYDGTLLTGYMGNRTISRVFSYTTGTAAVSTKVSTAMENINKATLTATAVAPTNTGLTYYLSNDGGSTWESTTSGAAHYFSTQGTDLRLKAVFATTDVRISPTITGLSIAFGDTVPGTPSLSSPADAATDVPLSGQVFSFSATDADTGDKIYYTFELSDNAAFDTVLKKYDQAQDSTGWSQSQPFASGASASFTFPYSLSSGATYYWRVKAKDLNQGTSAYSSIRSFTTVATSNSINILENLDTAARLDAGNTTGFAGKTGFGGASMIAAAGTFTKNASPTFNVVSDTWSMGMADLNGDGYLDIVEPGESEPNYLYWNNGDNTFTRATLDASSDETRDVAVGDLNNDGYADVGVVNTDCAGLCSGQNYLYTNNGDGTFTKAAQFGSEPSRSIAFADLDKDGDLDVVVGNDTSGGDGRNEIYWNQYVESGSLSFTQAWLSTDKVDTYEIFTADVEGDGDMDILLDNHIYLNDGTGSFTETAAPFTFTSGVWREGAVADLDKDGDVDVIALDTSDNKLKIFANDGTGNFSVAYNFAYAPTSYLTNVGVGDVNGDGFPDVVMSISDTTPTPQATRLYLNRGSFTFDASTPFDTPAALNLWVGLADFNNDGTNDVLISGNDTQLWLSTPQTSFSAQSFAESYTNFVFANLAGDAASAPELIATGDTGVTGKIFSNLSDGLDSYQIFSSDTTIQPVAAADVDNDGNVDIIANNSTAGRGEVYLNNGSSVFSLLGTFALDGCQYAFGDLDRDGDTDAVCALSSGNYLLQNDGAGNFTPTAEFGSGSLARVADVNNDGDLDVLVVGNNNDNYIYDNDGAGSFTGRAAFNDGCADKSHRDLSVGDLNNDGFVDVFAANSNTCDSPIYINKGDGTFYKKDFLLSTSALEVNNALITDLDGDGQNDIIALEQGAHSTVYKNQGSLSFVSLSNILGSSDAVGSSVAAADVDSDGLPELAIADVGLAEKLFYQKQTYATTGAQTVQTGALSTTSPSVLRSITVTAQQIKPTGTSIDYSLSTNGGVSWTPVTMVTNAGAVATTTFSDLRVKAELSTTSASLNPKIKSLTLTLNSATGIEPPIIVVPPSGWPYASLKGAVATAPDTIKWLVSDDSDNEIGFRLYEDAYNPPIIKTVLHSLGEIVYLPDKPNQFYIEETGLSPNTKYSRQASAFNKSTETRNNNATWSAFTLANQPGAPSVSFSNGQTRVVIKPNDNPASTEFAVFESTTSQWVDKGGVLRSKPVWGTWADFGGAAGVAVQGLENEKVYRFAVKAKNGDGVETDLSAPAQIITSMSAPALTITLEAQVRSAEMASRAGVSGKLLAGTSTTAGFASALFFAMFGIFALFIRPKGKIISQAKAAPFLVFGSHSRAFGKLSGRDEYGQWLSSFSRFKKWRARSRRAFWAGAGLGLVKVAFFASLLCCGSTPLITYGQSVTIYPGNIIDFVATIQNQGQGQAKSVTLSSVIPSGFELNDDGAVKVDQVSAPGTVKEGNLTVVLGNMSAAAEKVITWSGNVQEEAVAAGLISFKAQVISDELSLPVQSDVVSFKVSKTPETFRVTPQEVVLSEANPFVDLRPAGNFKIKSCVAQKAGVVSVLFVSRENKCRLTPVFVDTTNVIVTEEGGQKTKVFVSVMSLGKVVVRCGNGVCEQGETADTCPDDCTKTTTITKTGTGLGGESAVLELTVPEAIPLSDQEFITKNSKPLLTGQVLNEQINQGTEVKIVANNDVLGTAVVDEAGHLDWTPQTPLADGIYVFELKADSQFSAPVKLIIDTKPPQAEIRSIKLDSLEVSQDNEGVAKIANVRLSFSGVINKEDWRNGIKEAMLTVESAPQTRTFNPLSREWTYTGDFTLDFGSHSATLVLTDKAGNQSAPSSVKYFNLDENGLTLVETKNPLPQSFYLDIASLAQEAARKTIQIYKKTVEILDKQVINNPVVEKANEEYAAPIVAVAVAANAGWAINFFNLLNYLQVLFTQPILLLERRKRKGWGVVYNSLTKLPVDLAVVRLFSMPAGQDIQPASGGKLIQTRVTDKQGRYCFIVEPGVYRLEVNKIGYTYPTQYLKTKKEDLEWLDLYHNELVEVKQNSATLAVNIPLDPVEKAEAPAEVLRRQRFRQAQRVVALVGPSFALASFIISPTAAIGALLGLHVVIYLFFLRLARGRKPKSWGVVYDQGNKKPLRFVIARIFEKSYNKLLETQITDSKGHYSFLVGRNVYYLTFDRQGYVPQKMDDVDVSGDAAEVALGFDVNMERKGADSGIPPAPEEGVENEEKKLD